MPAHAYCYADYSTDTFSFAHWVHEPVPTYDTGQPVPETCKLLGNNIRYLRTLRRWSQEALGLDAGLNRTLIGAIERAEVNTSLGTAEKIARAFRLSVAELLNARPPRPFAAGEAFDD